MSDKKTIDKFSNTPNKRQDHDRKALDGLYLFPESADKTQVRKHLRGYTYTSRSPSLYEKGIFDFDIVRVIAGTKAAYTNYVTSRWYIH